MTEVHVALVPREALATAWPKVSAMVTSALREQPRTHEAEDVAIELGIGAKLLWIAAERVDGKPEIVACAVGFPVQYPRVRTFNIWVVAGDGLNRWGDQLKQAILQWAKADGCTWLEGGGRYGWKRWEGDGVIDAGPTLFKAID